MRVVRAVCSLVVLAVLAGCAATDSIYKQLYQPAAKEALDLVAARRPGPPPAAPAVERTQSGNSQAIFDAYAKRGYASIGYSMFDNGSLESEPAAIGQGRAVGADLVLLLGPRYPSLVTAAPAGGSSFANYGAVYFVRQRVPLGIVLRDLNDAERRELQTNRGAVVTDLIADSPAFRADILIGDVVTAMDGIAIDSGQSLIRALQDRRGKRVTLSLLRKGQRIEKSVQLNP